MSATRIPRAPAQERSRRWPGRRGSRRGGVLAAALSSLTPACGGGSAFTYGRELEVCEDNLPTACGVPARCVLDESHYLAGSFPGARRFIIRTAGEAGLVVQLELTAQRAPGTELRLTAAEPNCSGRTVWDSAGQDLFRLTGRDGVLKIPLRLERPGDHLVEIVSDAYCDYALRYTK